MTLACTSLRAFLADSHPPIVYPAALLRGAAPARDGLAHLSIAGMRAALREAGFGIVGDAKG